MRFMAWQLGWLFASVEHRIFSLRGPSCAIRLPPALACMVVHVADEASGPRPDAKGLPAVE